MYLIFFVGVTNDNADVINKFTIVNAATEDKFDKLEKEANDMTERLDKIEENAKVNYSMVQIIFWFMKSRNE